MAQESQARRLRKHHVVLLSRTEGIVLKSSVYGEADLIVTYLTRDLGLLKAFAKSPRKTKSRFGSSLEPLTYSRISLLGKEDAGLPRLTQSDIIISFHELRDDYDCFVRLAEILELTIHFLPEKEPNGNMFALLLKVLSKLHPGDRNALYFLFCKIRFLAIAGYLPRLEACGRCGKTGHAEGRFYVSHGALICYSCKNDGAESISLSRSALRFYGSILQWRFANIDRVNAPGPLIAEISNVIDSHIRYILARSLKSVAFAEKSQKDYNSSGEGIH
jgi:DNA repair protein RecO (recombination protein O)